MTAAVGDLTDAQRAAIGDSVEQAWSEIMAGARALDPARIRAGYVQKPTVVINGLIIEPTISSSKGSVAGWDH